MKQENAQQPTGSRMQQAVQDETESLGFLHDVSRELVERLGPVLRQQCDGPSCDNMKACTEPMDDTSPVVADMFSRSRDIMGVVDLLRDALDRMEV